MGLREPGSLGHQEEEDFASGAPGLREEGPWGSDPSPNTPSLKSLMTRPAPPPPGNLDPRSRDPVAQTFGMEKTQDGDALRGQTEAEGSQNPEELPPSPQSPPPPPSPRSPLSPETPELPQPSAPTEVEARQLLVEEWGPLSGKLELPPSLSWRLLFLERPLYRNLLSSPNPEGGDAAGDSVGPFLLLRGSCPCALCATPSLCAALRALSPWPSPSSSPLSVLLDVFQSPGTHRNRLPASLVPARLV